MNKLNLKDVTLFCIDDMAPIKAHAVMESVCNNIEFGDVKLFSSRSEECVTNKLEKPINTLLNYSTFAVYELHEHIDTEFAMCMQRDGYPLRPASWTDDFLRFDYIGAPWTWAAGYRAVGKHECEVGRCVGNGGFSIRSKRLMEEAAKHEYDGDLNEDAFICKKIAHKLEAKGIRFAPVELASYFSVENGVYEFQFGFHGRKTQEINKKLGVFK